MVFMGVLTILPANTADAADKDWTILSYDSPPFSFDDAQGKRRGLSVDIATAILEKTGLKRNNVEVLPWKRALLQVQTLPNTILHNVARLPSREKKYQWIGPYYKVRVALFKLKSRKDIGITTLKQAQSYRIAAERGSGFIAHDMTPKGLKVHEVNTNEQILKMLESRRIDLAAFPAHALKGLCEQAGISPEHFEQVVDVVQRDIYFIVNKETPKKMVKALRHSLEELKGNGQIAHIVNQY